MVDAFCYNRWRSEPGAVLGNSKWEIPANKLPLCEDPPLKMLHPKSLAYIIWLLIVVFVVGCCGLITLAEYGILDGAYVGIWLAIVALFMFIPIIIAFPASIALFFVGVANDRKRRELEVGIHQDASRDADSMATKESGPGEIVLIVIAVIGGLGVLSCLLFGGVNLWESFRDRSGGLNVLEETVKEGAQSDPNVQEQLGGLDEVNFDFSGAADAKHYGSDALSFKVSGPMGEGQIIIVQNPGTQGFKEGHLITDEGEWEIDVSKMRIE